MNCPTNVESLQQTETLMATLLMQADCLSVSRRGATAPTDRVYTTLNVKGVGTVSWSHCPTSGATENAVQVKSQVLYIEPMHLKGRVTFGGDYSGQS